MKKAQVSLEFIAMVSFAGIVLIVLTGAAYNLFYDNITKGKMDRITDFGRWVQEELVIASQVHDGYERTITLPKDINGIPYDVSISGNTLYVEHSDGDTPFAIPDVSGSISKGKVTIKNEGGSVVVS